MPDSRGRKTFEELQAEIDAQAAKQEEERAASDARAREAAANSPTGDGGFVLDVGDAVGTGFEVGQDVADVSTLGGYGMVTGHDGPVSDYYRGGGLGDAYDTVVGINDYRATPYTNAIGAATGHTANLYNLAAEQRGVAAGAAGNLYDLGGKAEATGRAYGDDVRDAAQTYQGDLYGVGDQAMTDAYGYAKNLTDIGDYAIDTADKYAGGLERRASGLEARGDYYGGALENAASAMMADPSYAELAGRAAMDRAAQEATARAASARGANANLMVRDAAGITASGNRNIASDLMAARAKEMADRRSLQRDFLTSAGDVSLRGRTAGADVYNMAGTTQNQGVQTATTAYDSAGKTVAQGRQQQGTMYTSGADVGMRGEEGRVDAGMAGVDANINASGKAADVLNTGHANSAQTATSAADTSMRAEDITAGSVNAANMANAGITSDNTKAESDFWKDAISTTAMAISDVRAKEDIRPISFSGSYSAGRETPYEDDWSAAVRDAAGSQDLTDPETNRRTLDTVNPYQYRYKEDVAAATGEDTAPRIGVMAQDLERSPAGSELVSEGPGGGKVIDLNRAASFNLAANAGLNQRLSQLEDDIRTALGGDYRRKYAGPRY